MSVSFQEVAIVSKPLARSVKKNEKLKIKNMFIVHRLMFIALVFFFVKCASGNFQILEGVNSKFCS